MKNDKASERLLAWGIFSFVGVASNSNGGKMTPSERVDRIAKELYLGQVPDLWNILAKALLERELEAAMREGNNFYDGYALAREQAANYLRDHGCTDCEQQIRQMEPGK